MAEEMKLATIDAFLVRRDEEGSVEPYEVEVKLVTDQPLKIKILPTTLRSLKGLTDPEADATKWPLKDKLRYVREHVVVPDFSAVSEEDMMDQMTLWDLDMLLIAAITKGGPERQRGNGGGNPPKRSGRSKRK